MIPNIEKQLAELGQEKIEALQKRFTVGEIVPYPYQCVAYSEIAKRLARYEHPFFIKAAVSAGKTIIFAMVAAQCRKMGLKMLTLARQSEIVDQDSKEISAFGVPNSVYCAGLGLRGAHFPIVVGSEGTVINGLEKALGDYVPDVLGIDECHQVNWNDIVEARENNETLEQMKTPKGEPVEGNPLLIGTGRTQYTVIIETMRNRCLEVNGRELRIFGMTGSEYRGIDPILVEDYKIPGFWREQVTNIDTDYLVKFGSVVPTHFGNVGDLGYDLSEFHSETEFGVADYSDAQLKAMSNKIHNSGTMTQQIMNMVHDVMKDRLCALVTCADARHCKEAAAALPEGTKYHIITGKTGDKQRREWLNDAYEGKVKYIFQVKALTTGVNIPPWDTSIILRKIGSLTLLVQLLGRGMRQLKSYHKNELGMVKNDHLVLDFSGTMFEMGAMYFNPLLEQAQYQLRKFQNKETKFCPICNTENSFYARRCIHEDNNGTRCEYFWSYQECEDIKDPKTKKIIKKGCGTKNDPSARVCRCCGERLKDPNEELQRTAYRKDEFYKVVDFKVKLTSNQKGILFQYDLLGINGDSFTAYETFLVHSESKWIRGAWKSACFKHIIDKRIAGATSAYKDARKVMMNAHHFLAPKRVTWRKNTKGDDMIGNKEY